MNAQSLYIQTENSASKNYKDPDDVQRQGNIHL